MGTIMGADAHPTQSVTKPKQEFNSLQTVAVQSGGVQIRVSVSELLWTWRRWPPRIFQNTPPKSTKVQTSRGISGTTADRLPKARFVA